MVGFLLSASDGRRGGVFLMDDAGDNGLHDLRASLERYLVMDDREKDQETQKAVHRLQKKVQEIVFLTHPDRRHLTGTKPVGKKGE